MSTATKAAWTNRIVSTGEKPAKDFKYNPLNWRQHPQTQRDALNEILSQIGWVTGVIENATTGNLIDGHARIEEAMRADPEMLIPFTLVELTEDEEKQILLVLDPIGGLAVTDTELFAALADMVDLDSSGLLETIASISRADLIETAEMVKEGGGAQEMIKYFSFGEVRIPMTDDEVKAIEEQYEAYVEKHGTYYGFPGELLGLK